jgi:putative glutamine amidotransferase
MIRPRIGITVDEHDKPDYYMSPAAYATAVERAGGLPFLLPYQTDHALIDEYLDVLDGILFSGGNDLDPAAYGQTPHPKAVRVNPSREAFEFALLSAAEKRRLPTLGVCMGCQLMNVHRGGSLHQFLPDQARTPSIEHRAIGKTPSVHDVQLDMTTTLGKAIGRGDIVANSYHKQAVDRLGRGLRVVATSPDRLIEAFEDPSLPLFAAVQWHPERLADRPEHLAPFRLLVQTARDQSRSRNAGPNNNSSA